MGTITVLPHKEVLPTGFRHGGGNCGSAATNFVFGIIEWLSFPFPTTPDSRVKGRRDRRGRASGVQGNRRHRPISRRSGASHAGDRRSPVRDRKLHGATHQEALCPFLSESADSESSSRREGVR